MVTLSGLKALYKSMRQQDIERYKFRYQLRHLTFDCLFFIDDAPFELAMGCIGHDFILLFDVKAGFKVEPIIKPTETYWKLINALKTNGQSFAPFEPEAFLNQLNRAIPPHADPQQVPTPAEIAKYTETLKSPKKFIFVAGATTWLKNKASPAPTYIKPKS